MLPQEKTLAQLQEAFRQTLPPWQAEQQKAKDEAAARLRARRRQEDEAFATEREAQRQALGLAAAAQLKEQMRQRFLLTPGATEEDFEAAWPEILRKVQIEQTLNGQTPQDELLDYFHSRNSGGRIAEEQTTSS